MPDVHAPAAASAVPGKKAFKPWMILGMLVSGGLAVVFCFYVLGMAVTGAAGGLETVNSGLNVFNSQLVNFGFESNHAILNVLKIVLPILVLVLIWGHFSKKE